MVKKFNLTEAAAEILQHSVTSKQAGQDKPKRLHGDTAYGTKEAGDIGTKVTKTNDSAPQATKGAPTATPPGAKPPVGSEPMKHLDKKFDAQGSGRRDLEDSEEGHEAETDSPESLADRKSSKLAKQTFQANKGSTFQQYHEEEVESDDSNLVYEEDDKEEKETKKHERKEKHKEKLKEDIDALLSGEQLSEEFINKATTIFEAAVMTRVEEIAEEVQDELNEQFETAVLELREEFSEKIDDYLNYVVEEWMKENEIAIETGLRAEIVEDFLGGLRNLFAEHYIDIPEDKVNVVEELAARVEELESKLDEQIEVSIGYRKEINEHKKIQAIHAVCEGLTQTQVEKLKSLAESVEFTSEEEFGDKVATLKEAYAPTAAVKSADKTALEEEVIVEDEKKQFVSADPMVAAVAHSLSKSAVK